MSEAIMRRLGAIQGRGVALYRKGGELVVRQRAPIAEGSVVLGRAFAVRRLAELAKNNGVSAIQTLRKRSVGDPPVVTMPYDYEVFLERNDGFATATALSCEVTADAFFTVSELLLASGDTAVTRAEALLVPPREEPNWSFEIKVRLQATLDRGMALYGLADRLVKRIRAVPHPARGDAAAWAFQSKCFKAGLLAGLVKSNALTGLRALNDDIDTEPPVLLPARELREFTLRNERVAGSEGLLLGAVADADLMVVEMLFDAAELAGTQAGQLLDS